MNRIKFLIQKKKILFLKRVLNTIVFAILLSIILYSSNDKLKSNNIDTSEINVQLDYKKDHIDEISTKQIYYFSKILEIVNEINRENLSKEILDKLNKRISRFLKKAAEISKEKCLEKYLFSLSENIQKGEYFSSIPDWLELSENKIEIIFSPGRKPKKLEFYTFLNNSQYIERIKKYISLSDRMQGNLSVKEKFFSNNSSMIPTIKVTDVVLSSNFDRFVLVYPETFILSDKKGNKIIIFRNLMELYFKTIIEPLSRQIFEKSLAKFVNFESYFSNLIMHKISHYFGPVIADTKTENITLLVDQLKDLFYCVEEIRADSAAIFNTSILVKEGLIAKEENIYATYLVYLVEKLRNEPESKIKMAFLVQFNYILKRGGFSFNINNKKLLVNKMKFKKAVHKLMLAITGIQKSGDYDVAEKFINTYNLFSIELKEINKLLSKIPLRIRVKANFGNN